MWRLFPSASRGKSASLPGWAPIGTHSQTPNINPVRLYLSLGGWYEGLMEWVTQYAEKSAKFVEQNDETVFYKAKDGDEVALHELIFRAVKIKAAYVAAKTESIASKNPDFDPQSVISYCLQKVLGNNNERFLSKIQSSSHFFGGFHTALVNRITDGYRSCAQIPSTLHETEDSDPSDTQSLLANFPDPASLPDQQKSYVAELTHALWLAADRSLNPRENLHLKLYAEGRTANERMTRLGLPSINATDLHFHRLKGKVIRYLRKHPDVFPE